MIGFLFGLPIGGALGGWTGYHLALGKRPARADQPREAHD
jgi:hypothetical protein